MMRPARLVALTNVRCVTVTGDASQCLTDPAKSFLTLCGGSIGTKPIYVTTLNTRIMVHFIL